MNHLLTLQRYDISGSPANFPAKKARKKARPAVAVTQISDISFFTDTPLYEYYYYYYYSIIIYNIYIIYNNKNN